MSEEGDTFWVSLAERLFGLLLIVIGAVMLYYHSYKQRIGTIQRALWRFKRYPCIVGHFPAYSKAARIRLLFSSFNNNFAVGN